MVLSHRCDLFLTEINVSQILLSTVVLCIAVGEQEELLDQNDSGMNDSECCHTLVVGGIRYVLTEDIDLLAHHDSDKCVQRCFYKKESDLGSGTYCFGEGDLPLSCIQQKGKS